MISENSGKKLKSSKLFEILYEKGSTVYSKDKLIKAKYFISDKNIGSGLKIAVTVSSMVGSAAWRNKAKRLMYESIRIEKNRLIEFISQRNLCLLVIFSPNKLNQKENNRINLNDVKPAILDVLDNIIRRKINKQ